jgi:hypothetical protein
MAEGTSASRRLGRVESGGDAGDETRSGVTAYLTGIWISGIALPET